MGEKIMKLTIMGAILIIIPIIALLLILDPPIVKPAGSVSSKNSNRTMP
jgi:hypothetical protein